MSLDEIYKCFLADSGCQLLDCQPSKRAMGAHMLNEHSLARAMCDQRIFRERRIWMIPQIVDVTKLRVTQPQPKNI